jgi:hypothetical protein
MNRIEKEEVKQEDAEQARKRQGGKYGTSGKK